MTSPERKALEAQFAIGLESAAALAAQGKSVCCVISEDRSDGTVIVRMHPEFHGRLPWGTELYVSAAPQPAQQAVVSEQQASCLSSALARCILASGIVSSDKSGFSGPELLFLAGDLEELLLQRAPQPAQQAGSPT